MDDDHELILVAAYEDLESARADLRQINRRIKHGLELRGAALVSKDAGCPDSRSVDDHRRNDSETAAPGGALRQSGPHQRATLCRPPTPRRKMCRSCAANYTGG
jgi:hypothetical protein